MSELGQMLIGEVERQTAQIRSMSSRVRLLAEIMTPPGRSLKLPLMREGANAPLPEMIDPNTAVGLTGVSLSTIYRWIDEGTVRATRLGKRKLLKIFTESLLGLMRDKDLPVGRLDPVTLQKAVDCGRNFWLLLYRRNVSIADLATALRFSRFQVPDLLYGVNINRPYKQQIMRDIADHLGVDPWTIFAFYDPTFDDKLPRRKTHKTQGASGGGGRSGRDAQDVGTPGEPEEDASRRDAKTQRGK